jgi:hypothetical protein
MVMTRSIAVSYQELLNHLAASGKAPRVLGRTVLDKGLVCVEMGGNREPSVVITSGSHASEWAGPLAALQLLSALDTRHKVYLVPCRDPLGLDGFVKCIGQSLGKPFVPKTSGDVLSLIDEHGEVVYGGRGIVIATVGHFGVILVDESQTRRIIAEEYVLPELLSVRPDLARKLSEKYLFFIDAWQPGEFGWEGEILDHPTKVLYVSRNGVVGNLNRFFNRDDAPIEVDCIRDLVDRVRPGLILDLHEGFGSKYYLIVPLSDDPLQDAVARAMTRSLSSRGFAWSTFEELAPFWGADIAAGFQDLGDGIYSGKHMTDGMSLGSYGRRYGPTATTETGMDASVEQRIEHILWSVLAGMRAFEQHYC